MNDRLDRVLTGLVSWTAGDARAPIDRHDLAISDVIAGARRHRLVGVLAAAVSAGDMVADSGEAELIAA